MNSGPVIPSYAIKALLCNLSLLLGGFPPGQLALPTGQTRQVKYPTYPARAHGQFST